MVKDVLSRTVTGVCLLVALTVILLSCASDYKLTSVTVSPATASLDLAGTTMRFTASAYYARSKHSPKITDVTNQVTWSSSDTNIATIDSSGLATAANVGPTAITATLDGISGTASLTVTAGSEFLPSLTVYPVGQGTGTIVSTPIGINCGVGAACSANFVPDSTVTLTATAASGVVLGFSSNCVPTASIPANGAATASCNVSMGGNQTVGVIFQ